MPEGEGASCIAQTGSTSGQIFGHYGSQAKIRNPIDRHIRFLVSDTCSHDLWHELGELSHEIRY